MVGDGFGSNFLRLCGIFTCSSNENSIHSSEHTTYERGWPNSFSRSKDREVIEDRKCYIEPWDMVTNESTGTRPFDFPVFVFFAKVLGEINFYLFSSISSVASGIEAMEASILNESFHHRKFDTSLSLFCSFASLHSSLSGILIDEHLRSRSSECNSGKHQEESWPEEAIERKAPSYVEVVEITEPECFVFLLYLLGVLPSYLISNPPVLDYKESKDVDNNVH